MGKKPRRQRVSDGRSATGARRSARALYATAAVCGLLVLAVTVVFGQTLDHGFVNYDDSDYVAENPCLAYGPAQAIPWAFTSTLCGNWHPLTCLSYVLDHQLHGLAPWGYHLTNIVLHAAAGVVLFLALRRMTGDFWPSAFVAAVFAIHPLRAESVAWVSERKDVLSGLFFMLTLGAYAEYVRRPFSMVRYLLVALLFALGLMAKPMLVTLPFVLLLLDYWPLGRHGWRLVIEKLPLLMLSAGSCAATMLAQSDALVQLDSVPLSARIANAVVSYAAYLGKFFYPVGLAVFYPHPAGNLPTWQVVGAALLLAAMCAAVVAWRQRCPYALVGWCWYLGMLVPVIGLAQVGSQAMADRYTYLPQIGLAIGVAWGAKQVCAAWPQRAWLGSVACGLVLVVLMGCAYRQTSFWRDSQTLWNRAIDCTARNAVAHYNLGNALAECKRADEALAQYQMAVQIDPNDPQARYNMAIGLTRRGQVDEALAQYGKAIELKPDYTRAHNNLGALLASRGQTDEAIAHYRRVLEIRPDDAEAHSNFGLALAERGQFDEAIAHYEQALRTNPERAEFHYNVGVALSAQGRSEEAIACYRKALELAPDDAKTHNNLGSTLAGRGELDEAIAHYRSALECDSGHANARRNLDLVRSQREELGKTLARQRELLRADPNDLPLLNNVAWTLATNPNASLRDGVEAVALAQRATQLSGGREAVVLGTLAAAYAEAGQFALAVETARKALKLAAQQNNQAMAESVKAKIPLYEKQTPFREMSRASRRHSTPP
jgi:protein O-mannosyl-transferase